MPTDNVPSFIVFDTSGIHSVNLSYCGCIGAPHRRIQLLRSLWFPASFDRPKTAFTFDLLNTFHLLNLQGKLSLYDFHEAIYNKSDNTRLRKHRSRYDQLLPAVRIFRHIKLTKRSARGHDPGGVGSTKPGQCAMECAACPIPQKNLPEDWDSAPASIRSVL